MVISIKLQQLVIASFLLISFQGFSQSNSALTYPLSNPPALNPNNDYPKLLDYGTITNRNYIRKYSPQVATNNSNDITLSNQTTLPCLVNTEYMDGVGKPFQSVQRLGSHYGLGRDIVKQYTYDYAGRPEFEYLPYAINDPGNWGKLKTSVKTNLHSFYNAMYQGYKPFEKTVFENNKLSRILMSRGPGGLNNKEYIYQPYMNSKGSVLRWTVGNSSTSEPVSNGSFADGDLFRTTTRGADGDSTHTFTDKSGKVVKKSVMISYVLGVVTFAETYYVYDDLDRLRWIIPPEATAQIMNSVSLMWPSIFQGYCFKFFYDERERLIEKLIPGKDVEYFIYDNSDRLVARQDGNMRSANKWEFTIYDELDRPVARGIESAIATRSAWANIFSGSTTSSNSNDLVYYYSNTQFHPTVPNTMNSGNAEVLQYFHYDDYSSSDLTGKTFIASYNGKLTGQAPYALLPYANPIAKGELTGTTIKVPDQNSASPTSPWLTTAYFYDDKGRLVQTQADNHTGGFIKETIQYDFSGDVASTVSHIYNPQASSPIPSEPSLLYNTTIVKKITKNNFSGLTTGLEQSINGYPFTNISNYSYDELGRVKTQAFGLNTAINNYTYNIQNWITGINADQIDVNNDKAFFKEKISYDQGFVNSLYSGDISGIVWQGYGASSPKRFYGYDYDKNHRLTWAEFGQWNTSINDWDKSQVDYTVSNITYDRNGNIKTMNQRGPGSTSPVDMDLLEYNYQARSNRLSNVTDQASVVTTNPDFKDDPSQSSIDYSYDNNGNVKTDLNRGIASTSYNLLNQPLEINVNNKGDVSYVYDASGTKLKKIVYDNTTTSTTITDYIGPIVFENNAVKYITHQEGRARLKPFPSPLPNDPPPADFKYEYFMKDHLGNVRSTITSELVPITDYEADHEVLMGNFENAIFDNIDPVRDFNPSTTNPNDVMSAQLDGNDPNRVVGTTIMLKVMAGDEFGLAVNTYFEEQQDYGPPADGNTVMNTLLNAMLGGNTYSGTPISELPGNINILQNTLGNPQNVNAYNQLLTSNTVSGMPSAHLNYLLFDEEFNLIADNSGVIQFGSTPNQWNTITTNGQVEIHQNGYLVAYVENSSPVSAVWADKFNLKFYKGKVLQEDHYYPFGLTLSTNPAVADDKNYIKYNGKELQRDEFTDANGNKSGLELYDYGARMMDPQIGRWNNIDNLSTKYSSYSPYAYVLNNPVKFYDGDGNDARVSVHGKAINIETVVHVMGTDAAKHVKELNDYAASHPHLFSGNSQGYTVNISVKYVEASAELLAMKVPVVPKGDNTMNYYSFDERSSANSSRDYDRKGKKFIYYSGKMVKMSTSYPNMATPETGIHETFHLLGLRDRYNQYDFQPHEGFKKDIMGIYGGQEVSQQHWDNWVNFIVAQGSDDFVLENNVDKINGVDGYAPQMENATSGSDVSSGEGLDITGAVDAVVNAVQSAMSSIGSFFKSGEGKDNGRTDCPTQ